MIAKRNACCGKVLFRWLTASAVLAAVGLAGCRGTKSSPNVAAPEQSSQRDHFELAWEFLDQRDDLDPDQAAVQTAYHVNRWIANQSQDPDWSIDPLIRTLPRDLRDEPPMLELDQLEFPLSDVVYLEQCLFLHDTARWIARQDGPAADVAWIDQHTSLNEAEKQQLAAAFRLFDWTVRNIQLDELLPYPKVGVAGPTPQPAGQQAVDTRRPPKRGEPGPGYRSYPWETLMYGHGDALNRARVFILLLRQQGIDAVMLGTAPGGAPRVEPWLVGVLIGPETYLFDTQLGLPFPAEHSGGVATLSQLRSDPTAFERLAADDGQPYRMNAESISQLVALVDASAEALSQRMWILQRSLDRSQTYVLALQTQPIKKRLEQQDAVAEVRLWELPMETYVYQLARPAVLAVDPEAGFSEFVERSVFAGNTPLSVGRRRHLRGQLENEQSVPGAKSSYLSARTPDQLLENILTSPQVREQLGIVKMRGERDEQFLQRIQQEQFFRTLAKVHATHFLALAHYDAGDVEVAQSWFQRTREADQENRWTAATNYNLARCHETLGQLEQAAALLQSEDASPQRAGNLIRARRLQADATNAAAATSTQTNCP